MNCFPLNVFSMTKSWGFYHPNISQMYSFLSIPTMTICHFTWTPVPVSLFSFHTLFTTTQHSDNIFVLNNLWPPNTESFATSCVSHPCHCTSVTFSLEFSSLYCLPLPLISHVSLFKSHPKCGLFRQVFMLISGWVKVSFNPYIRSTVFSLLLPLFPGLSLLSTWELFESITNQSFWYPALSSVRESVPHWALENFFGIWVLQSRSR